MLPAGTNKQLSLPIGWIKHGNWCSSVLGAYDNDLFFAEHF